MAKFCTPEVWEKYKNTKSSGPANWTLARAINTGLMYPSSFVGCHAGDLESWDDFKVRARCMHCNGFGLSLAFVLSLSQHHRHRPSAVARSLPFAVPTRSRPLPCFPLYITHGAAHIFICCRFCGGVFVLRMQMSTTQDLFYPVVKAYHSGFDPENTPPLDPEHMNPDRITVDLNASAKAKVISTRIRCARNLAMFPVRLLFYFLPADWFVCFRHMERYVRSCCRRFVVVPLRLCVA
jgi:hypothetical protein